MFKRIDHVEIIPADFEKALDFYTRILGFKIKQRKPGRAGGPFKEIVYLTLNDTMLEVIKMDNPIPLAVGQEHTGYRMMAIEVEDMDAAIEYLKQQGVDISRPPMLTGESKRAEIKDSNGLTIELRQWL